MDREHLLRLEVLYHGVMEQAPSARAAFLIAQCGDDTELRREVEALLEHSADGALDRSPWDAFPGAGLTEDSQLGPYRILAQIGAGGMGEVYRAKDTRLDRTVAIKVLPAHMALFPERRERFEREARAVSTLNHPHICTLYDVGSEGAIDYLVMEYLEGETLAARLAKGGLPLTLALAVAIQITDALEAAHRQGVVHRDLKPANVMLTKSGAKLVDFGLAKTAPAFAATGGRTAATTLTNPGTLVGTFRYMSPEQLEAKEVDARADIFAFGLVFFEMLTGKRAFEADSQAGMIAAILSTDPPAVSSIQPLIPPALDRIVRTCLARDPDRRWQSARDINLQLQAIAEMGSTDNGAPLTARRGFPLAWIAAAVLAGIAGVAGWALWRVSRQPDRPLVRLLVDLGPEASLTGSGNNVLISPDGTRLVYLSNVPGGPARLFTRRLDQLKATELAGTEGANEPFFSPDGQWVGFHVLPDKVNKISVEGGAVVPVANLLSVTHANWGEDGDIVVEQVRKGLVLVPSGGGTPSPVTTVTSGELTHAYPQILPGGKAVLFVAVPFSTDRDKMTIEVVTLADHRRKILLTGGSAPRYLLSGHLVYANRETLFAIPFDLDRLEVHGAAVPIVNEATDYVRGASRYFDISRTGTLVYTRGGRGRMPMTVNWVDRTGKREPLLAKAGDYRWPRLSPDGKRLGLIVSEKAYDDVSVYDQQRDTMARLTFGKRAYHLTWSPDGRYVVFGSLERGGGMDWARTDGAGQPQPLTETTHYQNPCSFTPDGKRLAYVENDLGSGGYYVWTVPMREDAGQLRAGKPELFFKDHFNHGNLAFSPDGRWLAYQSDESGKLEIEVRGFPAPASGPGGKWQISNSGGQSPVWLRNGRDLLYRSGDQVLAVSYTVKGDVFVADKPHVWLSNLGGTEFDLDPSGNRVAVLTPAETRTVPEANHEVVFLENFFDELRRRAPVGK